MIGIFDGIRSSSPAPPATGLKLWLKADALVTLSGSYVSAWGDSSGNGNGVSQATSAIQPVFNASSINGLPGITFLGNQVLANALTVLPSGNPRTVIAITKPGAGGLTSSGSVFDFETATPHFWGIMGVIGVRYVFSDGSYNTTTSSTPTVANTPTEIEWFGPGPGTNALTMAINGTPIVLTDSAGTYLSDTGTKGFQVGSSASSFPFSGDICELLVWDHVLSSPDLTTVRAYLHSRYLVP